MDLITNDKPASIPDAEPELTARDPGKSVTYHAASAILEHLGCQMAGSIPHGLLDARELEE
jgi:hypothetical protein